MIRAYSGSAGAPVLTDVSSLTTRLNTSDTHAASGTATPVPIPTAGTNYSYWVAYRPDAVSSPTGTVNNLRWYSSGTSALPAGVTLKAQEATSYIQATGTPGTTGTQLTTGNYATLTGAPVDVFTFTSGSPKSIAGSISNPSTGPFGSWFVVQGEVASTTSGTNPITASLLSLAYDES